MGTYRNKDKQHTHTHTHTHWRRREGGQTEKDEAGKNTNLTLVRSPTSDLTALVFSALFDKNCSTLFFKKFQTSGVKMGFVTTRDLRLVMEGKRSSVSEFKFCLFSGLAEHTLKSHHYFPSTRSQAPEEGT